MNNNQTYLDSVSKVLDENKDAYRQLFNDLMEYGEAASITDGNTIERLHPLSSEVVTIKIRHEERGRNTFEVGQLIKVKSIRSKRMFIKITEGGYQSGKGVSVYKPSPKSKLRNKSKFSKFKATIVD